MLKLTFVTGLVVQVDPSDETNPKTGKDPILDNKLKMFKLINASESGLTQVFTSRNWPYEYASGETHGWEFGTVELAANIEVKFDHFRLENTKAGGCKQYDYVQVFKKANGNTQLYVNRANPQLQTVEYLKSD
jgi:hypothetical protein